MTKIKVLIVFEEKTIIKEVIKISAKQDNTLESITQKAAQTAKQLSWANFAQNIFYGLYPEFK